MKGGIASLSLHIDLQILIDILSFALWMLGSNGLVWARSFFHDILMSDGVMRGNSDFAGGGSIVTGPL